MQLRAGDERMQLLGQQVEQERASHARALAAQEEALLAQAECAVGTLQVGSSYWRMQGQHLFLPMPCSCDGFFPSRASQKATDYRDNDQVLHFTLQ